MVFLSWPRGRVFDPCSSRDVSELFPKHRLVLYNKATAGLIPISDAARVVDV